MRPEKPLPPTSIGTPSTTEKKVKRKKKKAVQVKHVRARRRTIDPTKWDSQHLKGAFLDSVVVADDRDDHLITKPSQPQASDDQGESDLSSSQDSEGEEGDEYYSSECETAAGESKKSPRTTRRPPPTTNMECDVVDTDLDFNQEKLHALSLLDSMFGNLEGNEEWGGKEPLDSDTDISGLPPVQLSPSPKSSPPRGLPKRPDPELVVEEAQGDSESDESSIGAPTSTVGQVPMSGTLQNATTTKAKLKDLFAPQEEQSALLHINRLPQI